MSLHLRLVVIVVLQVEWQWLSDREHVEALLLEKLQTGCGSRARLVDTVDGDTVTSGCDVQIPVPTGLVSYLTLIWARKIHTKQNAGRWAGCSASCPRYGRRIRASLPHRKESPKPRLSNRSSTCD